MGDDQTQEHLAKVAPNSAVSVASIGPPGEILPIHPGGTVMTSSSVPFLYVRHRLLKTKSFWCARFYARRGYGRKADILERALRRAQHGHFGELMAG